jgi:hypothetical protein
MRLLERDFRGAPLRTERAPYQRANPIQGFPAGDEVPGSSQLLLGERVRHPGGVVEVSAARGDRGSKNRHDESVVRKAMPQGLSLRRARLGHC